MPTKNKLLWTLANLLYAVKMTKLKRKHIIKLIIAHNFSENQ